MKKTNKKGFTIIELVIVIAVIAILAAVLIPTFKGVIDKANESAAMQEAKNAYTSYLLEKNGEIPDDLIIVKTGGSKAFKFTKGQIAAESQAVPTTGYTKLVAGTDTNTDGVIDGFDIYVPTVNE